MYYVLIFLTKKKSYRMRKRDRAEAIQNSRAPPPKLH
jgi:hypothetical protein